MAYLSTNEFSIEIDGVRYTVWLNADLVDTEIVYISEDDLDVAKIFNNDMEYNGEEYYDVTYLKNDENFMDKLRKEIKKAINFQIN